MTNDAMGRIGLCCALVIALASGISCSKADHQAATGTASPTTHKAVVRINDSLVLAIPPEYSGIPSDDQTAKRVEQNRLAYFYFYVPKFSAYKNNDQGVLDKDRVEIVRISSASLSEAEPDAPGAYPPNVFKSLSGTIFLPNKFTDAFGLRCYEKRGFAGSVMCFGERDGVTHEQIVLDSWMPPLGSWPPNPQMQARYFSRQYGGVELVWRTSTANMADWRQIDSQIWKMISNWNTAESDGKTTSPNTGG
jgi:hypothetical protein